MITNIARECKMTDITAHVFHMCKNFAVIFMFNNKLVISNFVKLSIQ